MFRVIYLGKFHLGVKNIICGTGPVYNFREVCNDVFDRTVRNSMALCGILHRSLNKANTERVI
jgi:hypothetical protein